MALESGRLEERDGRWWTLKSLEERLRQIIGQQTGDLDRSQVEEEANGGGRNDGTFQPGAHRPAVERVEHRDEESSDRVSHGGLPDSVDCRPEGHPPGLPRQRPLSSGTTHRTVRLGAFLCPSSGP
jgi:hypothetical protein